MEYNFGQSDPSERSASEISGDSKDKKKKDKKTVRVPLSGVKPEQPEVAEVPAETRRRVPLHELFGKKPEAETETDNKAEKSAASNPEGDSKKEPETPEQPAEPLILPEIAPIELDTPSNETVDIDLGEKVDKHEEQPDVEAVDQEPAPIVPPPLAFGAPMFSQVERAPQQTARVESIGDVPPTIPPAETITTSPEPSPEPQPAAQAERPRMDWAPMEQVMQPISQQETNDYALSRQAAEIDTKKLEQEKNEAVLHAERRGTRRGVLTGGIVGWVLGKRRGRNKAERASEKAIKKQAETIKETKLNQEITEKRINILQRTREQLETQVKSFERKIRSVVANRPRFAEKAPELPKSRTTPERMGRVFAERVQLIQKPEVITAKPEKRPEDQPITEQTYAAPEGRRVEVSSWHRYEVDKATGKLVENPELAYGEEFKKEQRQERLPSKPFEPIAAAQLGQTIIQNSAARSIPPIPADAYSQPVAAPAKAAARPELRPKVLVMQVINNTRNPVIVAAAALLVVLLFAVGILS